jgi:hypothetical protein
MDKRTAIKGLASKLVALAKKRDYGEAVRLFKEVSEKLHALTPNRVAAEIGHLSGEPALRALVKSFALAPCYWCKEGYMTCELCQGADTIAANGRYCEVCGGYGHTLCMFCGGSGFLSFESVPKNILGTLAHERLKWSANSLQRVAKRSSRLRHGIIDERLSTELFDTFHTTLRITAVLDNIDPVIAPEDIPPKKRAKQSRDVVLAHQCRRVNQKYQGGFANAIVAFCQAQANRHSSESHRRTIWERRRDFYASQFLENGADQAPEE